MGTIEQVTLRSRSLPLQVYPGYRKTLLVTLPMSPQKFASTPILRDLRDFFTLPPKYVIAAASLAIAVLAIVELGRFSIGQEFFVAGLALVLFLLLLIQLEVLSRLATLSRNLQADYRQVESLFSVFSLIKPSRPIPAMRGWAVSPDFVHATLALIYEQQPQVIAEVGCGVSTLLSAYCLEQIGSGHIISLEGDRTYAQQCRQQLAQHQLQHRVTVVDAPLTSVQLEGQSWLWYDPNAFKEQLAALPPIDLLVVDGPQRHYGPQVRYPALPVLLSYLSDRAVIILDDADREGEQEVVRLWQNKLGSLRVETSPTTEKGIAILRRTP
jgi:predicted O-methyltransferase YrrM